MRLRLVREPFDHPDFIFELKHDGFRAIAYLQNGESKLASRNQRNLGFEADAPCRAKEATCATRPDREVLTPALRSAHRAAREELFRGNLRLSVANSCLSA